MSTNPVPPPPAVNRQRLRWLVPPAVALAIVAGFGFGPSLIGTSAGAAPILPDISAQDLVAKVVASDQPAFSGTVQTHTNLGLPSLGSFAPGGSSLLTTLLSPQTIKVSSAPGGEFHLAIPNGLSETDVVSDGTQLWVWQSGPQSATHVAKPADAGGDTGTGAKPPADATEPTPDAIAQHLLSQLDPTTRVFVRGTASVAGRDAYELVLAPTSSTTLVADVVIDVDATTSLPLRIQVLAKDAGTPALDIAFADIAYGAQPDSAFTFTPPPGAKVTEAATPQELLFGPKLPADRPANGEIRRGPGPGGRKVVPPPGVGAAAVPAPSPAVGSPPIGGKTQVLGSSWDSVLAIPDGPTQLGALGRPVSGAWGSGRLVTSTLADALVLDNGTVLVGLVGPDRLEAAVAEVHP